MGKKKVKKKGSDSYSLNASNKNSFTEEQLDSDSRAEDSIEASHFKVLLSHNTDEKDKYYKWMKSSSWKNVAFINSEVLSNLQCGAYLILQGKQFSSIFIAFPLKTVKKSTVVILSGMGFEHEELVSIYPFMGEGYEAEEIFFLPISDFESRENIKALLRKKLCNQFIWPNQKIELVILETKYEFKITEVKYLNKVLHRNFSRISESLEHSSNCDISLLSDSRRRDVKNTSASELHLSSIFSAMTIQDYANIADMSSSSQSDLPKFFTLSYQTKITFCSEQTNLKNVKSPLFEHIGGYKKQVLLVQQYIKEFLEETEIKVIKHRILMLKGPSGTGKSMILKAVCNENNIYVEKIDKNYLLCKELSDACKEITEKINNLAQRTKSILLLDDFDILCPSKSDLSNTQLLNLMHDLILKQNNILVLNATSSDLEYDELLVKCYSICEIKLPLPTLSDREEIIEKVLSNLKHNLSPEQIKLCAEFSQGMSGREIFKTLKYDGSMLSLIRIKNTSTKIARVEARLNFTDVKTAIKKKKLSIISPDFESKKVKWSDIGGMNEIKEKLIEEMKFGEMCPENIKRFNYSPSRGILFYGPPGCCKTMIARALATECNWNFISKKASDILNMYVGESEKAVTNLFLEARIKSPCIIFLDEIDALAPERSSCASASGVGNRIVNALLTEMAGIETLKDVMIIAATNRPNIIDTALLRRGRIGQHIYIPLPDAATRREILLLSMKKKSVAEEVDFDCLVERTNGYTGAEIVHLCNEAAMQLLTDEPECCSPVFKTVHFERALSAVPPRTLKETIEFYERFSLQT